MTYNDNCKWLLLVMWLHRLELCFLISDNMRDRRRRLERLRRLQQQRNAAVLARPRQPNRGKKSVWLFDLPDTAFKLNCRFNKPSVNRIAALLDGHLRRVNRRGNPVPPKDMVAVCLNQLCGVQFQRTNGLASGGLSQNASRVITFRVVDALVAIHKEWIKFPTTNKMMETSLRFYDKFGLPNIFGAVDGCHMHFEKAPRALPAGQRADDYISRKGFHSLNVQICSNDKVIYDVDAGWPGSTHDARVFRASRLRNFLETDQSRYMIAADSAYPISLKVMKHYERPTLQMHHTFNCRLNGLRTVSSENVYGRLKQRFPILRQLRMDLTRAQRVVLACCVLHNMAEEFKDEVPPRGRVPAHLLDDADDDDNEEEDDDDDGRNAQVLQARAHRDTYANNFYQAYLRSRRGY